MADAKKTTTATDAKSEDTATTVTKVGTGSAEAPNEPGPSNGTDTKDETARAFVQSGASAEDYIKRDFDAPSGDEMRKQRADIEREGARDNLANLADGNSNHNTVAGVNPVGVAFADRPDYNPQRRPSSRANQQSTMGESPERMAQRVDAKKEAKTNAEITTERRNDANETLDTPLTSYQSPYAGEQ